MNWISLISLNMTESNQVSYTINKPLDYVGFTFQPMLPQRFPALGQLVRLGFTRSPGLVSCLMSWAVKVQVSSQQKRGLQWAWDKLSKTVVWFFVLAMIDGFINSFLFLLHGSPWNFFWTPVPVCVCFCWSWSAIPQTSAVRDSDSPTILRFVPGNYPFQKKGCRSFQTSVVPGEGCKDCDGLVRERNLLRTCRRNPSFQRGLKSKALKPHPASWPQVLTNITNSVNFCSQFTSLVRRPRPRWLGQDFGTASVDSVITFHFFFHLLRHRHEEFLALLAESLLRAFPFFIALAYGITLKHSVVTTHCRNIINMIRAPQSFGREVPAKK